MVRPKRLESVMEGTFTAQNLLVEKKQFLEVGGFRTDYHRSHCDDMDLGERALIAGLRIWYAPELTVEHYDPNLLDFKRFAIRQYHGCIAHAQFFTRFSAPRERSRALRKDRHADPGSGDSPVAAMEPAPADGDGAGAVRFALGGRAVRGAPLPDAAKWLLFRASISSQMAAGFVRGRCLDSSSRPIE